MGRTMSYQGQPPGRRPYAAARKPVNSLPVDLAILGCGVLVLVMSEFAFYAPTGASYAEANLNLDAYHGFFGWAGVWLVYLGAMAVVVPLLGVAFSAARMVGAGVSGLGLLLLIIGLFVHPEVLGGAELEPYVTYYVALLLALAVTGLSIVGLLKEKRSA